MIASMTFFATSELGMPLEDVLWKIPASYIMLMCYQKNLQSKPDMMNLQDMEMIDKAGS